MDIGIEFGAYRIIDRIGRGGMADVWSARDKRLNRTVAIKTIARTTMSDLDPVALFEREAKTIAALEHPHILPIYEFGDYHGQLYIVMRYVSGGSVETLLQNGALALDDVLRLARPIAQALDYAHTSSVVHLDLKPSNILLDSYRSPYLADFGLSAVLGPEGRAINPGSGTLLYMAPEQLTSEKLDSRADVYAFCILLYHMMTGQLPFDGGTPLAIKQMQTNGDIPDIRALLPDVPPSVTDLLRHGTRYEVEKRVESVMEILHRLESALTGVVSRVLPSAPLRATQPINTPAPGASVYAAKSGDLTTDLDFDMLMTRPFNHPIFDSQLDVRKTRTDLDKSDLNIGGFPPRPIGENRPPTTPIPADGDAHTINISDSVPDAPLAVDAQVSADRLPDGVDMAARAEAMVIYTRARRAWANGQGKFLLGLTPYMLMDDFYSRAADYKLDLDDTGRQLLLRGALEYDYKINDWWTALDDDSRQWVVLHALRSENPQVRKRALNYASPVTNALQFPNAIMTLLKTEREPDVRIAALVSLKRGRASMIIHDDPSWRRHLENPAHIVAVDHWRELAYSSEIDGMLAALATQAAPAREAEIAADAIAYIGSEYAVRQLIAQNDDAALSALATIRESVWSLPSSVSALTRARAWLLASWRKIMREPSGLIARFLWATLGGWLGMAVYIWLVTPSLPFLEPARIGLTLSVGLGFGVIFGLQVLVGSEIPGRLKGLWYAWARGLLALILGGVLATFSWSAFTYLYLLYPPEGNIIAVGLGTAVALTIPVVFHLRIWMCIVLLLIGLFVPIYDAWVNFRPPVLYVQDGQDAVLIFALTLGVMSVGAYIGTMLKNRSMSPT